VFGSCSMKPRSMSTRASAAAAPAWATVSGMSRTLAAAGDEDAVGKRVHRGELGMPFEEEALGAAAHVEQAADPARRNAAPDRSASTTMSTGMRRTTPAACLPPDDELALLLGLVGPVGDLGHAAADRSARPPQRACRRIPRSPFRACAYRCRSCRSRPRVLLEQVRELERVHAADARAPAVGVFVARADAMDDGDPFGAWPLRRTSSPPVGPLELTRRSISSAL
jgi:hypothetical protein